MNLLLPSIAHPIISSSQQTMVSLQKHCNASKQSPWSSTRKASCDVVILPTPPLLSPVVDYTPLRPSPWVPPQAAVLIPVDTPAASVLISFLRALPDCRMRRGIRCPQWWMLLESILLIHSGQGSLVGLERFAKRNRQTLNELLGTDSGKSPSDSAFRLLLSQLDMPGLKSCCTTGWLPSQV